MFKINKKNSVGKRDLEIDFCWNIFCEILPLFGLEGTV